MKKQKQIVQKTERNHSVSNIISISLLAIITCLLSYSHFELSDKITTLNKAISSIEETIGSKIELTNNKLEILNKVKIAGNNELSLEKIEQLNAQADKYHIIYLTNEIANSIDNTSDYSVKLSELSKLLSGKFQEEMIALQDSQKMNFESFKEIEQLIMEAISTETISAKEFPLSGMFKISKKNDNRILVDQSTKEKITSALQGKDEWELLKLIEGIEKQNDKLKIITSNLSLRSELKFHLKNINDGVLSHD